MARSQPRFVCFVASEVAPWSQTGGLADVVGSLPRALEQASEDVRVVVFSPLYPTVRERARVAQATLWETDVEVRIGLAGREEVGHFWVHRDQEGQATHFFLEHPGFFDREGIYTDAHDHGYPDNALRFAFLCAAALEGAPRLLDEVPVVFHAHDWQGALVPIYLHERYGREMPDTRAVFTIHNLAYQGVFPKETLPALGLDWSLFTLEQLEFYDQVNLLKGGVAFADAVTTVSPTYAREIQTPPFGEALDGFLRRNTRRLSGILNGLDPALSPSRDPYLHAPYDAEDLSGKPLCRTALLEEVGVERTNDPVFGVVSRFAHQKGLDLVADLVPALMDLGVRGVILGSGDRWLEGRFRALGEAHPGRLAVRIGFEPGLARRIVAGTDLFLVPSRFEPCGLTQMHAMAYGTPPVVHAVGGLKDTVIDPGDAALARGEGTGFCFHEASRDALYHAVARAVRLFREDPAGWRRVMRAGMRRDASWAASAREYLQLYDGLT